MMSSQLCKVLSAVFFIPCLLVGSAKAELTTWDGKYPIDQIEVTVVYFVPKDRSPLPDWQERVAYYCNRIEAFHEREFKGASKLKTLMRENPYISSKDTTQLRKGDADSIFFKTMEEVDKSIRFGRNDRNAFPILLVLSDINWKPLDDFYRLRPTADNGLEFEGNYDRGRHFPGAESGGARAIYWDNRGVGWGLVSGDGWRVPYSGSDCVVYHEGVGHSIGLPHPDKGNSSVMSLGQYHGWINQSYLDNDQKERLGFKEPSAEKSRSAFSLFTAVPTPVVPKPEQLVELDCQWPTNQKLKSLIVEIQTDISGPWVEVHRVQAEDLAFDAPSKIAIGRFDRVTPVSYRVRYEIQGESESQLWGYFQVRKQIDDPVIPSSKLLSGLMADLGIEPAKVSLADEHYRLGEAIDLLGKLDVESSQVSGKWELADHQLTAPKQFGARLELPKQDLDEYQLTLIVEPLDEPNGLVLGAICDNHRFAVLLNYSANNKWLNALENIDGRNVGNESTVERKVFVKNVPSEVVYTIRKKRITVSVDGELLVEWEGDGTQLSLSDYWNTPNKDRLFLGAYDCSYRITRMSLRSIEPSK